MSRSLRLLSAAAVAAGLLVGCGTSKSTQDASIAACNADPGGGKPTAQGQVVNTSSETSSFFIRIGFYDVSDNRISEGATTLGSVDPGALGSWTITGAADANGPLTCKVMTLRRTSVINT
ncbi:MAG: FxLYD domain-containing protein [Acidimicrobiales bacterium]